MTTLTDITKAESTDSTAAQPIIFFDGVCGLCNSTVDFVIAKDRQQLFRFAPLQGTTAKDVLEPVDIAGLKSLVLQDELGLHRRSTAVVRMLKLLGGFWGITGWLLWVIHWPLRGIGYRLVSRFRYRLFGQKESCRMPTPAERERFLP